MNLQCSVCHNEMTIVHERAARQHIGSLCGLRCGGSLRQVMTTDEKLAAMAELCRRARVEQMHSRSIASQALDEAIRMVDPSWQGAKAVGR